MYDVTMFDDYVSREAQDIRGDGETIEKNFKVEGSNEADVMIQMSLFDDKTLPPTCQRQFESYALTVYDLSYNEVASTTVSKYTQYGMVQFKAKAGVEYIAEMYNYAGEAKNDFTIELLSTNAQVKWL